MPLYVPLCDALHITRQVTVETILLGEDIINSVNPTSGVMMAVLAIGRIGYGQWLRFVFPLTLMWLVIAIIIGVQILAATRPARAERGAPGTPPAYYAALTPVAGHVVCCCLTNQ